MHQRETNMPNRIRVAIPSGECMFNLTTSLDIMELDGRSVLHLVEKTQDSVLLVPCRASLPEISGKLLCAFGLH